MAIDGRTQRELICDIILKVAFVGRSIMLGVHLSCMNVGFLDCDFCILRRKELTEQTKHLSDISMSSTVLFMLLALQKVQSALL